MPHRRFCEYCLVPRGIGHECNAHTSFVADEEESEHEDECNNEKYDSGRLHSLRVIVLCCDSKEFYCYISKIIEVAVAFHCQIGAGGSATIFETYR